MSEPFASTGSLVSNRKQALIAEDNNDLRYLFSTALRGDFDVSAVSDGQQALEAIASHVPDLLVLDLNMPNVAGLDVLHFVKDKGLTSKLHIIVLTGNHIAASDPITDYADFTLIKPVRIVDLQRLANRIFNQ